MFRGEEGRGGGIREGRRGRGVVAPWAQEETPLGGLVSILQGGMEGPVR